MKQAELDTYFMQQTIKLAKKGEGFTSPNPLVGAVIVKRDNIISYGYHKRAGLAHAEIEAIRKAKVDLSGATLYVNLEPCFHFGRTPPCVDEIIKNKIKRVVIAIKDPNPYVCGKSIKKLRGVGVKVKVGVLSSAAKNLNEVFFKNMQKRLPFVAAKIAQSLDGKIATKKGISKWITAEAARKYAKSLRDKYDCVLIGANTAIKDRPSLNGLKRIPFKAVIDPDLRIPKDSFLCKRNSDKLIIFASLTSKKKAKKIFPQARIFFLSPVRNIDRRSKTKVSNGAKRKKGVFSLKEILRILYQIGIRSVFVEGGAATLGNFFDQKLVDKVYFFIAPKIIGGVSLSSVGGQGYSLPLRCPSIKEVGIKRVGEDILVSGYAGYGKK